MNRATKFRRKRRPSLCRLACLVLMWLGAVLVATAQGSSDAHGRLRIPAQVMAGQCLTMVSPHVPQVFSPRQSRAVVELEVEITSMGRVVPLRTVSGPPALENEAMNAVRLWRYRPYMHNGVAVDVITQVAVTFTPGRIAGLVTHPTG